MREELSTASYYRVYRSAIDGALALATVFGVDTQLTARTAPSCLDAPGESRMIVGETGAPATTGSRRMLARADRRSKAGR
jgi:hypothetical protein